MSIRFEFFEFLWLSIACAELGCGTTEADTAPAAAQASSREWSMAMMLDAAGVLEVRSVLYGSQSELPAGVSAALAGGRRARGQRRQTTCGVYRTLPSLQLPCCLFILSIQWVEKQGFIAFIPKIIKSSDRL